VREFGVLSGIGEIAAGRNVKIVELDPVGEFRRDVARVPVIEPVEPKFADRGQARDDRNAMIAGLGGQRDKGIAEDGERLAGEILAANLDLLQAQDVRFFACDQRAQGGQAQPDRIDVPGQQAKDLARRCFSWTG
jgi:hypothetical protein